MSYDIVAKLDNFIRTGKMINMKTNFDILGAEIKFLVLVLILLSQYVIQLVIGQVIA